MHDPSGCNSTYNTHDEIRWYDQDSLIFISGLTEIDAVMGNDEKFLSDIKEAAREFHPKFIALVSSPIPFMNGTDFPALAKVLEIATGIPSFAVPTNGMHDYVYGAGIAFEEIAKRFVTEKEARGNYAKRTVNLLGATPLDFGPFPRVEELKNNLEKCGWEILSTWAMGDSLEDLVKAGNVPTGLIIFLAAAIVCGVVLNKTKAGRYILCLGSNKEAVRLSGVDVKKWEMLAYVICGILVGIAAIFYVGAYTTVQPGYGDQYNNEAIAGCVMGGTSMAGGLASIGGTVIGVLIISLLQQGILALGFSKDYQFIITGIIVIAAVYADVSARRRKN